MIAYYVHHQGTGHQQRALAVTAHLRTTAVGLSSRAAPPAWPSRWIHLADDARGVDCMTDDVSAHATFHWLPRHHAGLRDRMGAISVLLAGGDVAALVSDVSVEVAVLARLHGVPVVIMAQPGDRRDRAHRLAYDLADLLLAPWPAQPRRPWPNEWSTKTVHLGGLSRYDGRPTVAAEPGRRRVLVVWGSGGVDIPPRALYAAAAATPEWTWRSAGPSELIDSGAAPPPNLTQLGWVEDLWPELCHADVVITHAGQNAVAEVAAARRPAVVIPQARPFGEQVATAHALRAGDLATVIDAWPGADSWSDLLDQAAGRDGARWAQWSYGDGAQQAANAIEALVGATVP